MPEKFYILSTGRCGTTFLSNLISKNNPHYKHLHQQKDSKKLNILSNLALSHDSVKRFLLKNLAAKYGHELPPSTVDPLRSTAYALYLDKLYANKPEIFDDCLIIHLIRDPRDFVTSFINWKNRKFSGILAHHLIPFWMPEPKLKKKINMSKFEHFCWIWKSKNALIQKSLGHLDNYRQYRIEEIQTEPEKLIELIKLVSQNDSIVFDNDDGYKNSPLKKTFPYWQKWNSKQALQLEQICGNLMHQYGYGGEDEWKRLMLKNGNEE